MNNIGGLIHQVAPNAYLPFGRASFNGKDTLDSNTFLNNPFAPKPTTPQFGPPVSYGLSAYQQTNQPGYAINPNIRVIEGQKPFQTYYQPQNPYAALSQKPPAPFPSQPTQGQDWQTQVRQWGQSNLPLSTMGKQMLNTVNLNITGELGRGTLGQTSNGGKDITLTPNQTPYVLSHELNHTVWDTVFAPNNGAVIAHDYTTELFNYMSANPNTEFTARMWDLLRDVNHFASQNSEAANLYIVPTKRDDLDNPQVWNNVYQRTPFFNEVYADLPATIQFDIRRMPPQLQKYYPQWTTPSVPLGQRSAGY